MGFLADRKILITGVLSNRSIAYGVAKACQREGATLAFTYVNAELKDRVVKLAADFGNVPVLPCDVARDLLSQRVGFALEGGELPFGRRLALNTVNREHGEDGDRAPFDRADRRMAIAARFNVVAAGRHQHSPFPSCRAGPYA